MTDVSRRQRVAAGLAWVLVVAVTLAGIAGNVLAWRYLATGDAISSAAAVPAAILYATLGALIVRRAGNIVGWVLLNGGMATAVVSLASAYAVIGTKSQGTLPGAALAGLLAELSFLPLIFGIAVMFLIFPTGRLPSPRWRPAGALCLLVIVLAVIETAIHPGTIGLPAPGGVSAAVRNPLGVRPLPGPLLVIGTINAQWVVLLAVQATSAAAMIARYRSGDREQRQQIKWIALTAAAMIASALVVIAAMRIAGTWAAVLTAVGDTAATAIGLAGFPIAIAVAVLKYRLYQIDVIITRAVSYGLLSAALTAVYAGIVVGIGTLAGYAGGPVLTVAAAVVVAVLFHPLRQRAAALANRFVYGRRSSPYQVLAGFAEDMAGQLDADADAAPGRLAALLAGATGAVRVEVFVLVGAGLVSRAVWPEGAEPAAPPPVLGGSPLVDGTARLLRISQVGRAAGVYHQGDLLGAITLEKARSDPVSAAEDKLLTDLASQAGLVLRNVRLTAELRATIDDLRSSRRRLVRAQDEERQRIERNLHDGAQQQLVALSVGLTVLDAAADDPEQVRELAGQLRDGLRAAIDDLRALARGIYPPLLADRGLAAALRAQADRAPMAVHVDADGVGRLPREAEVTAYFCVLEALQNVAKYAAASRTTVELRQAGGQLTFLVTDDGAGFDLAGPVTGSGLQGMRDRLAALGGSLTVSSARGRGTTVAGALPCEPALASLVATG
jgi:signal transduction histidine kinase